MKVQTCKKYVSKNAINKYRRFEVSTASRRFVQYYSRYVFSINHAKKLEIGIRSYQASISLACSQTFVLATMSLLTSFLFRPVSDLPFAHIQAESMEARKNEEVHEDSLHCMSG